MSPSFFITICLGGIVCLTPIAVYLFWLGSVSRRNHPTVVSAAWDFIALLVALGGFLFSIGVILAGIVYDATFFTGSPFAALAPRLSWQRTAWVFAIVVYLVLLAMAIRRGLRERAESLVVYNIDAAPLDTTIDEALLMTGRTATKTGNTWLDGGAPVVEVARFPIFSHATVKLASRDPLLRETLENQLRAALPRLPAAADNLASPWISGITTCITVAVGCCIALIFALPFL